MKQHRAQHKKGRGGDVVLDGGEGSRSFEQATSQQTQGGTRRLR